MISQPVQVTITAPNTEWLRALAVELVEQRLLASANIIPTIESVYRWQGRVEQQSEALLLGRTQAQHVDAIVRWVDASHPYETPHVVATLISGGNPDYLAWVTESTDTEPDRVSAIEAASATS